MRSLLAFPHAILSEYYLCSLKAQSLFTDLQLVFLSLPCNTESGIWLSEKETVKIILLIENYQMHEAMKMVKYHRRVVNSW